jgi:hypothetical protein
MISAGRPRTRKSQPMTHATMLNLMGMDHKRLTYFYNGRNMRLT